MKIVSGDYSWLELPSVDRVNVPVYKGLYEQVKKSRMSGEHRWQTIQRLLIAGINAEYEKNQERAA